jgi:hypothetical protein
MTALSEQVRCRPKVAPFEVFREVAKARCVDAADSVTVRRHAAAPTRPRHAFKLGRLTDGVKWRRAKPRRTALHISTPAATRG